MSVQVEGHKVTTKPNAISIQVGAAVFSCPIDWDDPEDVLRVLNHSIGLVQAPLRNQINQLLRENAELKSQLQNRK